MSGGGKGGSQTSAVTIPKFMEDAAKKNLARADQASQIGYTPFYGADVAAFTPQQNAAFGNTNQAAQAFGLLGGEGNGMPPPQTFAGGMQGYSSGGLYDQALAELQARRPGQYNAINDMFIDPITGEPVAGQVAPAVQQGIGPGIFSASSGDWRLGGGSNTGNGGIY